MDRKVSQVVVESNGGKRGGVFLSNKCDSDDDVESN